MEIKTERKIRMDVKKVTVVGGGVLGSQIAFQSAFCGYDTVLWLRSEGSIGRTMPKLEMVRDNYLKSLAKMNETHSPEDLCRGLVDSYADFDYEALVKRTNETFENMKNSIELDLAKAVEDADLVIESMTENFDAKKDMFLQLAKVMPEKTVICTNSSSLLPSKFTKFTGRPDRFLALHFANDIYRNNAAEIMCTKDTSEESFETVVKFAEGINMIPLKLKKEKAGYLLNSMLIPFLLSAMDLYVDGISDYRDINDAWVLGTGAPAGPFEIFDIVGINTAYEIIKPYVKIPRFITKHNFKGQAEILEKMIKEGNVGKAAGKGFYKYDEKGNRID